VVKDQSFLMAIRRETLLRRDRKKVTVAVLLSVAGVLVLSAVAGKVWSLSAGKVAKHPGAKISVVQNVKNAPFNFLAPGDDDAWTFNEKSMTFDPERGVLKYGMRLKYADQDLTVSQQVMPDELKGQKSPKFMEFIQSSNVVRSQQAGDGTVYYVAALQNGAQANGATSVIYVTDKILMFGRAGGLVGYDAWASMLSQMREQAAK
jgi:hypothetical protein